MIEFVDCRTCKTDCVRSDGNYGYTFCDKYTHPPMTNADRIRAMTDEELADCIYQDVLGVACRIKQERNESCSEYMCRDCLLEWLKQPAEGE